MTRYGIRRIENDALETLTVNKFSDKETKTNVSYCKSP